ncbi:MAG: uroporphyrinogen decarboxylase family protein [Phycisphaerae bacterium]
MTKGQPYSFSFFESVGAELAGVSHYSLHVDVEAMVKSSDALVPLCGRLGVPVPPPHLYGMSYVHASTIGVKIINGPGLMEPSTQPCLKGPDDIDGLHEPDDYLAAGVVQERLVTAARLKARRPDASEHIGHEFEGPVTTAVLMMGPDFFMLPYDDPARAHKLLAFCTTSAINYARAIRARQGKPVRNKWQGMPDDFAGMFPPEQFGRFVAPYWAQIYENLGEAGGQRAIHSELLREGHLRFLEDLKIDSFDPSVDQFLPPEVLARSCRVGYGLRIWPSVVRELTADQLVEKYRYMASFGTQYIMFGMERPSDEPKIAALLKVARELAKPQDDGSC